MPIIELKCEPCDHVFEKIVRPSAMAEIIAGSDTYAWPACPKCGAPTKNRIVSANSRQSEQWAETSYIPTPTAKKTANKLMGR